MQEHDPRRALAFHPNARSVVYFGPFRLDLSDGLLTRGGDEVRLPPRALAILRHLVERPGRVVSKASLLDVGWKDAHVGETSLTEAVGLIRQALGDDPQTPTFIQTVHRRGYRFVAPITTDTPASSPREGDDPRPREPMAPAKPVVPAGAPARGWGRPAMLAGLAGGALAMALGGAWLWTANRPATDAPVSRVNLAFAPGQAPVPSLNAHPIVTLSPDGRRVVYVGGAPDRTRLFLREMDRFDAVPIPGTDGAHGPFFSPDGTWVAFFANGLLKKVRVADDERAAPQVLCATDTGVGGTWASADAIVFAPNWRGPLMQVPASGGRPVPITPAAGPLYRWPDRIDDDTIVATRWRSSAEDAAVVAVSLASGAERVIAEPGTFGRYVPGGYVLFLRDGDLHAVKVDPPATRPLGTPVRVIPAVMTGMTGAAQFTASPSGSLLYIDDIPERSQRTVARVDDGGVAVDLAIPPRDFRYVSACEGRLAATVFSRGETDLWIGQIDRAAVTQLTRDGSAFEPIWSPDCRAVTFSWNRTGVAAIHTASIETGEVPRVLFESPFSSAPGSWSSDGRWLAYTEQHPDTSADIWLWDRQTGQRRPLVATAGPDLLPALSPDGAYVAYETGAAGAFEIEVASIRTGARTQVSVGGGTWPSWSADGRQLYYLRETDIMRVEVAWLDGRLVAADPVPIFTHPDIVMFKRAGEGFVWLRRTAGAVPVTRANLVLNGLAELDRSLR